MNAYIKIILILGSFHLLTHVSFAQNIEPCAFDVVMNQAYLNDPNYEGFISNEDVESRLNFEKIMVGNYIIPTVVHVIYDSDESNISDSQIHQAIEMANMQLAGGENGVDTEIELRLAKIDPNGNCTNGITRHLVENSVVDHTNDEDPNTFSDVELKNIERWPVNQYLNIWIVRCIELGQGCGGENAEDVAGYSYMPGALEEIDGQIVAEEKLHFNF